MLLNVRKNWQKRFIPFDVFKEVFDDFVINVLNKRPSRGKNHEGLSPDQLFNQECAEVIKVESDALKLFCTRTSKNYTIRRNGIKDNELGITYWIKQTREISLEEKCANYKAAYASVEKEIKPKVSRIANTNMDKVIRKSKEMDAFGRQDLSMLLDENKPQEKPLYLYETDKILEQELKGVANGY